MPDAQRVVVRRAGVPDAGAIAQFVSAASQGNSQVDEVEVIERFGSVGFMLAERVGVLAGMVCWQAENLVVSVTDLLVWPASVREQVGAALFSEMERAAAELECEVALLFLPDPAPPALVEFCRGFGYEERLVLDLPRAWREAAYQLEVGDNETLLLKRLREAPVSRPL
jgi:N-acetylglutamate synthase-like GNAT family acetyltransferase